MTLYDPTAAGTAVSYDYSLAAQTDVGAARGEIESLRSEMSRYAATIDELHARLASVLKPEYAEPGPTMDHPMPVMSDIATIRSQLAENTSRLTALISRVDL